MKTSLIKLPLCLAILTASNQLLAEEQGQTDTHLDKQVITATRTVEGLASLPYTVQIIS
jgi:outer membrane cobalamin receptor